MQSSWFDLFIALDGAGLDGFEGFAGVARLRCRSDLSRHEVRVRFFDGLAGGHAVQLSPSGKLGFLGNLSQTLLFFDPETLEERTRASTLPFRAPSVPYESQTHVVWLDDERCVAALGPDFYELRLADLEHPVRLGPHGVTLPHAIKKSASGRFLFYGAMDHDRAGVAHQVGIFDLASRMPTVVSLPATVWHLGVDAESDVFYAPTQRCEPDPIKGFSGYTISHAKNYLFEIDGAEARVRRHLAIPKDLPGALTSDVVVTREHVLYNCCASSVIACVDRRDFRRVRYVDERVGGLRALAHARAGMSNLLEAAARVHLPGATDRLLQALRATRGSALDGSYGLQLSPDGRFLLSAHRGLNQVLVYDYPELRLRKTIAFPPIRTFFPDRFGVFDDPRLGFHHSALSGTTAA